MSNMTSTKNYHIFNGSSTECDLLLWEYENQGMFVSFKKNVGLSIISSNLEKDPCMKTDFVYA